MDEQTQATPEEVKPKEFETCLCKHAPGSYSIRVTFPNKQIDFQASAYKHSVTIFDMSSADMESLARAILKAALQAQLEELR